MGSASTSTPEQRAAKQRAASVAQSAMEEGAVAQLLEGATEAVAELKNLPAWVLILLGAMVACAA